MRKSSLFLILVLLVATSAMAVVDPTPNRIGLYWDLEGNYPCKTFNAAVPTDLYIIYTFPIVNVIEGFECGIDIVGDAFVLGVNFANPNALDVAPGLQNYIVGFGSPTNSEAATLLATLTILPTSNNVQFYLHEATPASIAGDYPVIFGDGELQQVDTSTLYGGASAIIIPYICEGVLPTEKASWGSIKSLYR